MAKVANSGQMAEVGTILAHHERGFDIAQAVIERKERVLEDWVITATIDGITPPIGGRIHVFLDVPVDESRPWDAAIDAAGPNTPADCNVRKVSGLYPPKQVVEAGPVILVNFGPGSVTSSAQALAWGKSQKLRPASPRRTFAIGERHPTLDATLGMKGSMAVVSLEECSFEGEQYVCHGWWVDSTRRANFGWLGSGWLDNVWFAFVRE